MNKTVILVGVFLSGVYLLFVTRYVDKQTATPVAVKRIHSAPVAPAVTPPVAVAPAISTAEAPAIDLSRRASVGVPSFPTPSAAVRPFLRMQINADGSVFGVFSTNSAPVRQARFVESTDGFYYRVVNAGGEIVIDGAIERPVERHQVWSTVDGERVVRCEETPSKMPVFFDIPNVSGRFQVYATQRGDLLATINQSKQPICDVWLQPGG